MTWRIYVLKEATLPNSIRYVGYTTKPLKERLYRHVKDASRTRKDGSWFVNDYKAHWLRKCIDLGQIPLIEEIEQGDSVDGWKVREPFWIDFFKKEGCELVNTFAGGVGPTGYAPTAETKAKLSAALKEIWQDPDQRQKRRAGVQREDVIAKRNLSIKKAYENPEVAQAAVDRLHTPEAQRNRWAGYKLARAAGRVGCRKQFTEEQLQPLVQAYLNQDGCIACISQKYQVPTDLFRRHLHALNLNTHMRRGTYTCKIQGSKHKEKIDVSQSPN